MTGAGKNSSEIKDDFVLITMFAGTQANAYNLTNFYNVAIWTFCIYTNQSINLQVGTCIQYLSMIHVCQHPSQCIQQI